MNNPPSTNTTTTDDGMTTSNKQSSKDHLDNDKELRDKVLWLLYPEKGDVAFRIMHQPLGDEIVKLFDAHAQSKLKAFAGDIEEAIGEDIELSPYVLNMGIANNPPKETTRTNLLRQGQNKTKAELRQALKAIKEKYQL